MGGGVALLNPQLLTPDRILLWVVFGVIGLLTSIVLETRRRESFHKSTLLKESYDSLKELSFRDGLTGAYNRRFFQEMFEQQVGLANRKGRSLCLILFDLDRFKNVNDTYGHAAGDRVLQQTVSLVQGTLRGTDILNRYGGEEFVILLLDTPLDMALLVAERIREKRATTPVDGLPQPVTMSLGVAQHHESESPAEFLERTDKLLYRAKDSGRNQSAS